MIKSYIRMLLITLGFILLIGAVWTQQKPAKAEAKADKAPVIDTMLVARFFKAQSQLLQAQEAVQAANQKFQAQSKSYQDVIAELTKVCGDDYQPTPLATGQSDPKNGDPVCTPKPKPEAKK
jgi:hypothetical protein